MVLTIRNAQLKALEAEAQCRFEEKLLDQLGYTFARQYVWLGREAMRVVVRLGAARAAQWQLRGDRHVLTYVALMLMLGAFFDEDPQLPWAAAALHMPARGAVERLDELYDETMSYLDAIVGEENERLVRALVRLRDFDPASLEGTPAPQFDDALIASLSLLYPEKAAVQGPDGLRAALAVARRTGAAHGIAGAKGITLLACMAFMLGSGFASDPQVPWIAKTLASLVDEVEKVARLHSEALDYVAFGLSRN